MNYYPHHIGDYLKDTAHLSMIEDGAYRRLIDLYYLHEQPLPAERTKVYRLARAITPADKAAVDTILDEYFECTYAGWTHKRCDAELAKSREKSQKARTSAAKRWESEGNANADANAMRTQMPTHSEGNAYPITNNQEPKEKNTPQTPRKRGASTPTAPALTVADLERLGVPDDVAAAFLSMRAKKRAPLTELALAGILREADKAGWPLDRALRKCIERGWQGFEAEWVRNQAQPAGRSTAQDRRNAWSDEMDAVIASATGQRSREIDMGVIDATDQPR